MTASPHFGTWWKSCASASLWPSASSQITKLGKNGKNETNTGKYGISLRIPVFGEWMLMTWWYSDTLVIHFDQVLRWPVTICHHGVNVLRLWPMAAPPGNQKLLAIGPRKPRRLVTTCRQIMQCSCPNKRAQTSNHKNALKSMENMKIQMSRSVKVCRNDGANLCLHTCSWPPKSFWLCDWGSWRKVPDIQFCKQDQARLPHYCTICLLNSLQ